MQVLNNKERNQPKRKIRNRVERARRVRKANNSIIANARAIIPTRDIVLADPERLHRPAHEDAHEEVGEPEDGGTHGHDTDDPDVPSVDGDAVEEDAHGQLEEDGADDVEELAEPPGDERGLRAVGLEVTYSLACSIRNAYCFGDVVCCEESLGFRWSVGVHL